jgi:rSAM/selenodomain-associated transferase 2
VSVAQGVAAHGSVPRTSPVSVIVPVLDDAAALEAAGPALRALADDGHDLLVVDGGSEDGSAQVARRLGVTVIEAPRGRARQMNAGAARACCDTLLFLHADTALPPGAPGVVSSALERPGAVWGRFDVRLSGSAWPLRVIERAMNLRSRLTGVATGDQAIFVRRMTFESVGGYPEIELMEDVALSVLLRAAARPCCLRERVVTSSRRWERDGVARTLWLMWRLRLAYAFGAAPAALARRYYGA